MAFPGDYNWKVDITSDSTKVDSNESNFPYYFDLSNITSTDFWSNVQSDGGDLRVSSDSAGSTQLPLEVVSIDTVGETGEIHFKDSTDSASDKTFYLWWDDSTGTVSQPAVTGTYGRNNVWTNYDAVYHLDESAGSTATNSDGSGDGTYNGSLPTNSAAQLGDGQDLDGTGDYVDTGTVISTLFEKTVTTWIDTTTTSQMWLLGLRDADSTPRADIDLNRGGSGIIRLLQQDNGGTRWIYDTSSATSFNDGAQHHLAVVFSATTPSLYLDGASVTLSSVETGTISTYTFGRNVWIGGFNDGSLLSELTAILDEFRVYNGEISSGWVGTEEEMQSANSTFWTVGTPTSLGSGGGATDNALFFRSGI